MKTFLAKKRNIFLARLFLGQLGESYQQIIAYIGAVLCLIIMLLLMWGLKYYKK
ncbi:immunity protein BlpL [Streptococcus pneumoniae]|nr:immunity protein BlpL [Streptococcus pneumoniae]